jgi:hypothetical protein
MMISSLRKRIVDEAMDAYVDWREECIRVWDADRLWLSAARGDAALAFRAYLAALDREERAAEVYAGLIRDLDQLVATPWRAQPTIVRPRRQRVSKETADDE